MKIPAAWLLSFLLGAAPAVQVSSEDRDYFAKWLNEDVVYLITDEEKAVFQSLSTPEEKENFIEEFWRRRDPTPGTAANEFKEEHYRRIAYANEHFTSGIPGWKTDRGRVYILFGPPDEINAYSGGGTYLRPYYEGGGATQTFPFEKWWYRHVEGVGDNLEYEFVDRSWSGEYKLAQAPHEKDMMLYVDGAGVTLHEYLGLSSRLSRPAYQPGLENSPRYRAEGNFFRSQDLPFARMERYFATQRPPEIRFTDLREMVETKITYQQLPFGLRQDALLLDRERWMVPITVALRNQDLGFTRQENRFQARVNVYGRISNLTGRIFAEFEDTLNRDFPAEEIQARLQETSVYQRMIALPPGLYKLSLVLKSVSNDKIATGEARIELPKPPTQKLYASSLILARSLGRLERLPEQLEQFVIGDFKVVPSVTNLFGPHSIVGVYMQVYNAPLDQQTQAPSLQVSYLIVKEGKVIRKVEDLQGNSLAYFSEQRLVLAKGIPLEGISPGSYTLRVVVQDQISGQRVMGEDSFAVLPAAPASGS